MFVSWLCLCSIQSGTWAQRVGCVLVRLKSKLYRLQCRRWWRSQGEATTCPCRTFTSSLFSSCLQRMVSHPPRSLHSLNMDFYLLEDNVVSPKCEHNHFEKPVLFFSLLLLFWVCIMHCHKQMFPHYMVCFHISYCIVVYNSFWGYNLGND